MKRTLMMLVAVLAMATVASVQAADLKVELKERDANQKLVPAQNVKYSVSNGDGEIVADGDKSEFALDVAEGNFELTVEQTTATDRARYGAAALTVPAAGAKYAFEITDAGLKLIKEDDDKAALVIPNKPVASAAVRPIPNLPQLPPQAPTGAVMYSGNNWGIWGLAGALVATAIALGVDDDNDTPGVSGVQR